MATDNPETPIHAGRVVMTPLFFWGDGAVSTVVHGCCTGGAVEVLSGCTWNSLNMQRVFTAGESGMH